MTISDLLDSVLPRLTDKPQCNVLTAAQRVQTIIVNRLLLKRSNLLKYTLTACVSSGDEYFTIPSASGRTMLAIAGAPYLTGRKYLKPWDDAITVGESGQPKYYERTGRRVNIYPVSDGDYDITVPVYLAPAQPTALTDDLPFDGLLDDVFAEAVYGVMVNGTSAVSDRAFTAVIDSQVDQVLLAQGVADEQALADSINYH